MKKINIEKNVETKVILVFSMDWNLTNTTFSILDPSKTNNICMFNVVSIKGKQHFLSKLEETKRLHLFQLLV